MLYGFGYGLRPGLGEIGVGWSELETLQRDINGLLETNHLDWEALANEPMSSDERALVQKAIATRNVDLLELLHRKWALESASANRGGVETPR